MHNMQRHPMEVTAHPICEPRKEISCPNMLQSLRQVQMDVSAAQADSICVLKILAAPHSLPQQA